jgi:transposase
VLPFLWDEHVGEICVLVPRLAVASFQGGELAVDLVSPRCCGLDVHKRTVVSCILITQSDGSVERHMRSFKTMTTDLLEMAKWLDGFGVTHVAMESTGVYWRPVFNILESDRRTVLLVNPQHMRAVPGKKTDVKDAEWIADLLRHGLLRASFIPSAAVRELRELTRYRKTLVQERADEIGCIRRSRAQTSSWLP